MAKKPRENRVPIMMSDDELKAIDDWRFQNRVATRSDAIRRLAQYGARASTQIPMLLAWTLSASDKFAEDNGKDNDLPSEISHLKLRERSALFQTQVLTRLLALMPNRMVLSAAVESSEVSQFSSELEKFIGGLDFEKQEDRDKLNALVATLMPKKSE